MLRETGKSREEKVKGKYLLSESLSHWLLPIFKMALGSNKNRTKGKVLWKKQEPFSTLYGAVSVPGLTVLPVDESRGTVDDPPASLAGLNPPKPRTGKNVILGLEIPFWGGLFTGFWNHGKWKCEMRQAHAAYSNTWWLNNVGRQQMGSECYVFPEDSSLSAKVYISKNLYWFSQFSLVLLVNLHKYVFRVQFHSKHCILWLKC